MRDRTAGAASPDQSAHLLLRGEAETERLGRALARSLRTGDLVALSGGLGAGKSALARAVIRARLGRPDAEVPSPSYTLVNVYETPAGALWHADLYRLGDPSECDELGLDEGFASAVTLLEWPERLGGALPGRRLDIALAVAGEEDRRAVLTSRGAGWPPLAELLAGAGLEPAGLAVPGG
ncbi:MAG: tRNA (adenosine(37)-N6)-threonylcarbamoyltransferase complex ATPase subunit type 1 TsaE [Pseudomonadota bacterium]